MSETTNHLEQVDDPNDQPVPPNILSKNEAEQLHDDPPKLDYEGAEEMIRTWIMDYEGFYLVMDIIANSGVTKAEWELFEEGGLPKERLDEIRTIYDTAEDRAYLIVLVKLYQRAVNFSPPGRYK